MIYTREEIVEGVAKAKLEFIGELKKWGVDDYIINLILPDPNTMGKDVDDTEVDVASAPAIAGKGDRLIALIADTAGAIADGEKEEYIDDFQRVLIDLIKMRLEMSKQIGEDGEPRDSKKQTSPLDRALAKALKSAILESLDED